MSGSAAKVKSLGGALKAAFISNPIGVAITAIATAFSIFSSSSDDAEQAAADVKSNIDDLTTSLDASTGAFTSNTKAAIANQIGPAGEPGWALKRTCCNSSILLD